MYLYAKTFQQCEETYLVNTFKAYDIDTNLKGIKSKCELKKHVKTVTTNIDNVNQQKWYSDLWNDKNNDNGNKLHLYRLLAYRCRRLCCAKYAKNL